jgi:1-phosphatidylinositol phosphodiesterase
MSKVKIISAAYGTKNAALVVTEKVQQLVDKGETRIAASNKLFGDPSPGHTKHLAINYLFNGVKLAGACKEHQTVAIASFPNANWMSRINGSRKLSEINMPGTHDSCALFGGFMTQCQELSIAAQLILGVRFLDIRCRHLNNVFTIHHGSVYQKINFGDVVQQCIDFLVENPSETIVMGVKRECKDDPKFWEIDACKDEGNTRSFEVTLEHYMHGAGNRWYVADTIPNLQEVRGKIVLVRRFEGKLGIPAYYGWKGDSIFTLNDDAPSETAPNKIRVQDCYKVAYFNGYDEKWNNIEKLLNEAAKGSTNVWYWNFTSGTSPGAPDLNNPRATAIGKGGMNSRLKERLPEWGKKRVGTIILDFVSDDGLLDKIIAMN